MEKVDIKFTEDEWRYFSILKKYPEDMKCTINDLVKQTGDGIRAVRKNLIALTEKGYLTARNFKITELGESAYREHMEWRYAILWVLRSWGMAGEQAGLQADRLLFGTSQEFVECLVSQYDTEQVKQTSSVESEFIDNTDFFGQLDEGNYRESICFWDLDQKDGYFYPLSPVGAWFDSQAELVIELQKSRVNLHWISGQVKLEGIFYRMMGRERFQTPKRPGEEISLPVMAFSFVRVPRYRMLEGSMDARILVQESDREGKPVKKEYAVRMELPMIFNRFCEARNEG